MYIITSQSGNFYLMQFLIGSRTASELKLTKGREWFGQDNWQEDKWISVKKGSLYNVSTHPTPIFERSTPSIANYFNEKIPLTHSILSTFELEETSRDFKLEMFPRFGGNAPLNPACDRFRYCKFSRKGKNRELRQ